MEIYIDYLKANGHGHVVPRTDGHKADCGGPKKCVVCKSEQCEADAQKSADSRGRESEPATKETP